MKKTMMRMAQKVNLRDIRTIRPLALLMVVAIAGCGTQETEAQADSQTGSAAVAPAEIRVINVEVTEVALGNFTDYIRVIG